MLLDLDRIRNGNAVLIRRKLVNKNVKKRQAVGSVPGLGGAAEAAAGLLKAVAVAVRLRFRRPARDLVVRQVQVLHRHRVPIKKCTVLTNKLIKYVFYKTLSTQWFSSVSFFKTLSTQWFSSVSFFKTLSTQWFSSHKGGNKFSMKKIKLRTL